MFDIKTEAELSPFEWNFNEVPDDELVGCCYWEYARESAFFKKVRERCLQHNRSGGRFDQKLSDDLQTIQGIGYPSEVFLPGFFFEAEVEYQSQDEEKPNYRNPDAPPITGSFPAPWQSLSQDERKCRANIRTDIGQLQIVPVKLADWFCAKEIARECQRVADVLDEQRRKWERKYRRHDEKGNIFTLSDAPDPPQVLTVQPRTRWGVGETLMIDIAWECFTDDEIVNYFRKWVKLARPKEIPKPDSKGRNKARDWRVALERLAMMRLLHQFRLRDLPKACPTAWRLYYKREWYKERKRASRTFHRFYQFAAKEEQPISWPTRGGRSK